ncbi:polysaccharide deacetylase family protein [Dactylosporangium aurantiacum]|uniref:Polysaccharide deacetylase family protein n=1 Tax=Dactylosporangium aurantiacum TaxID=35754 RepID=A0A9Q9IBF6_9ACTN|nr:polysaccharide deacetylase family protein [Dactylosporangium aurantiacum]MDG6101469.1 polysaccharide deacetylase family protein [Dactylosporangium aurantiacum]UWZ52681.1 polysaccharide deacetylase family protein [Dactylosporangium aurantiacum]
MNDTPSHAANCSAGHVGLTFDDGPDPATTGALLSALLAAGARATFFNIGRRARADPSLVRAQQAAGMWTGNHSWTHAHLTELGSAQMSSEISRTQQAIQQATGTAPKLFRPPYGETNATLRGVAARFGLTEVLWSVDSQDWNGASTAQIVRAASHLQAGDVMLMHDGYRTTIDAIPRIVADLAGRGLCPGMISTATGRAVAPDGTTTPPPGGGTTPPPGGGTSTCTATYAQTQRRGDRFNGQVTIRAGSTAITSWTATVTVGSGQRVSATWNGSPSWDPSGNVMTMRPDGNGSLPVGGSTTFGFTVMVSNGNFSAPATTCRTP